MEPWVADYTRRIAPATLRAAGVVGVCRYLARSTSLGKIIGRAEYRELTAAGFDVVLNWEQSATDWLGGAPGAREDATDAVRLARALGYPPGKPIPGSADFDMSRAQWDAGGRAYAVAYRDTLRAGGYGAGVYGPWDVLTWCRDLGGFDLFWQCKSHAFSAGRNAKPHPAAHLLQRLAEVNVGGQSVDRNEIRRPDWAGLSMEDDDMTPDQAKQLADIHFAVTQIPDPANPGTRIPLQTAVGRLLGASPTLSDEQVQAIADQLIASGANGLTPADHAGVVEDLKVALASGHLDVTADAKWSDGPTG